MNAFIILITKGAELVATLTPVASGLAASIKALLESSGEYTVVMKQLTDAATDANAETQQMIDEWMAEQA